MTVVKGAAALQSLKSSSEGTNDAEFAKFKSGDSYNVAVKSTEDLAEYYNYGHFSKIPTEKVNSFVPKVPPTRNAKGFITENATPWDKAAQYYFEAARATSDKEEEEELKKEARKYNPSKKFIYGFHDLATGKDFVVDVTKKQAEAIMTSILKYEKKIGKLAFELSKQGESTGTTVTLTPIIDMDEDLTEEERKNFDAAVGQPFDDALFEGLNYEASEQQQLEYLVDIMKFDVTLIGYDAEQAKPKEDGAETPDEPADISEEDLPF
ncbi:hypothetical protein JCM19037_1617 [Geomicrobium sp. JCM 19037]|uniref:hypothetical protein n=1 Tax=Geomicrobium sp. JCM 19037 TaxID=1460634 RepID=UPI00045F425D|nr:hypothetical protein [Geomicrobium sp. JCM 19037]GAK03303.1 hypothetical protein JCM19037_1617 [Geomicrobium sp. JCM 19037]